MTGLLFGKLNLDEREFLVVWWLTISP